MKTEVVEQYENGRWVQREVTISSALTPAERRRKADEKKRSQGLVRVSVWVPEDRKAELIRLAGSWVTSPD